MIPAAIDPAQAKRRTLLLVASVVRSRLKPKPKMTVSEWADENRILPETSPESGRWSTNRTPYLREIMDEASNPNTEEIVWMKAVQSGGSEAENNILGYFIDQDPAPILFVQISTGEAKKYSKERIAPMIAACPALAEKVSPTRSRDSDNTIESKAFPGGHLGIVGANAPSGLRSRPRRVILFDEVDGYPASAGNEGDPIDLAEKRVSNFWNALKVKISTPTVTEISRIEEALAGVDEVRRYHVPCPHCHELQVLEWGGKSLPYGIKWDSNPKDGRDPHETAYYLCRHCHSVIDHELKAEMLRDKKAGGSARWIADKKHPNPKSVGFHLNSLYSPWVRWSTVAAEFLKAKGNPFRLQVWTNTRMAEVWDDAGASVAEDVLLERASRATYTTDPLPERVVLITAGADVQDDRLELEIVGWGPEEENWSLDYVRLPGDPTTGAVWKDLDLVLRRRFEHPWGMKIPISATCIDSRYQGQQVLKFAKGREVMKVWPIYGQDGGTRPIIGRPSSRNKLKVPRYPVGVDNAKALVYSRLLIQEPGPGYCHFPNRQPPYDEEFFRQLTSEKMILKETKTGRLKRLWVPKRGRRTEVLDCRNYATAAYEGLTLAGMRVDQLWELAKQAKASRDAGGPKAKSRDDDRPRRGGRWATGWK